MQQGLLRSPGVPGPGAKYDDRHLDRLRLIRRLQREHLPLAEIRRRLETMSDSQVRGLVEEPARAQSPREAHSTSAAEYARRILGQPAALMAQGPDAAGVDAISLPPPAAAERSQWERISLSRDLELHLRRPLSPEQNKMVKKLLAYVGRLQEEETP